MRIVLDTNVLVSGLLSPFGKPGEIVRLVSSGELTLALDARILTEYSEVLKRPRFSFDQNLVAALLEFVIHVGVSVAATPVDVQVPDPNDLPFIEVALSSDAQYLVTGNKGHFPARCCSGVPVVSPTEFMRVYRSERNT